jgi:hypothetical protein
LWGDGRMNVDDVWTKFLELIKADLTTISYDTWFADTQLYKIDKERLILLFLCLFIGDI